MANINVDDMLDVITVYQHGATDPQTDGYGVADVRVVVDRRATAINTNPFSSGLNSRISLV